MTGDFRRRKCEGKRSRGVVLGGCWGVTKLRLLRLGDVFSSILCLHILRGFCWFFPSIGCQRRLVLNVRAYQQNRERLGRVHEIGIKQSV